MTDSLLVERKGGKLVLSLEYASGAEDAHNGQPTKLNEEQLHDQLCRQGWLRVGPVEGDPIAGLYVRKAAQ